MSLYNVVIDDREYQVNISEGRWTVNGEVVNAKIVPLNENGLQLMRRGGQSFEVFLSAHEDDVYQMTMLGGRRIVTRVTSQNSQAHPVSFQCRPRECPAGAHAWAGGRCPGPHRG